MPICEVEITNRQGLHMRPAADFVKIANRFPCRVTVSVADKTASGKSIVDLLELAGEALQGANMRIEAEGGGAKECLEALGELIRRKFNED